MEIVLGLILFGWGFVAGAKIQEYKNPPAVKSTKTYGVKYDPAKGPVWSQRP